MVEYVGEVTDELRSVIERGNELSQAPIEGLAATSALIAEFIPELPTLPLVSLIPAPREIVRASFDIAELVFKSQRRFAEGIVEGVVPVTNKLMPWTAEADHKRSESSKRSEGSRGKTAAAAA